MKSSNGIFCNPLTAVGSIGELNLLRALCVALLVLVLAQFTLAQTPVPQDDRGIKAKATADKPAEQKKAAQSTTEKPDLILQTGHSENVEPIPFIPHRHYLPSRTP